MQAEALGELAPRQSAALLQEAPKLARAIGEGLALARLLGALAARVVSNTYWPAQLLIELTPPLCESSIDWLSLWPTTLAALARRPRPDLLSDLAALAPLVRHLGGEAAGAETLRAVRDAAQWWP